MDVSINSALAALKSGPNGRILVPCARFDLQKLIASTRRRKRDKRILRKLNKEIKDLILFQALLWRAY